MAKERKQTTKGRRGTHYTEREDATQINFRTSAETKRAFYASVIGTREQSLNAAVILWLGLDDYPEIRAKAVSLQKMEPKAAAQEMQEALESMVTNRVLSEIVRDMPAERKQKAWKDRKSKKGT